MSVDQFWVAMRDALRQATPFVLDPGVVLDHHFAAFGRDGVKREEQTKAERQFLRATTDGLAAIARSDRDPALNATTGHVAESITETLLAESGWTIVEQQPGDVSAGHGIDLGAFSPDLESLFVIEVKGSLSAARWPQLSRHDITQFSPAWLDKPDQPGMTSLGVEATDVYGLVVTIQFGLGSLEGCCECRLPQRQPHSRPEPARRRQLAHSGPTSRVGGCAPQTALTGFPSLVHADNTVPSELSTRTAGSPCSIRIPSPSATSRSAHDREIVRLPPGATGAAKMRV